MPERLEQLNQRYEELSAQLSAPETYADPELVARLNREQRELEPVVQAWRELTELRASLTETETLLRDPDQEVRELAREELPGLKEREARMLEELKGLLLPKDPDDDKDVVLEVRAGVGGEEAALFAHSLCRMYSMYADARGGALRRPMSAKPSWGASGRGCSPSPARGPMPG